MNIAAGSRVYVDLQASLLERRSHGVRVPRLNAKGDVIHQRAAPAALREIRRERIASTDDNVADVSNLALDLAAFVVGRLPSQQIAVEGRAFLVVGDLKGNVVEPD